LVILGFEPFYPKSAKNVKTGRVTGADAVFTWSDPPLRYGGSDVYIMLSQLLGLSILYRQHERSL